MARDKERQARLDKLRQRQQQESKTAGTKQSRGALNWGLLGDDFDFQTGFFKPQTGRKTNIISIIPFQVTQDWYAKLRGFTGHATGRDVGDFDYKLEYPVHRDIGPDNKSILCLSAAFGKPCPVCEEIKAEAAKKDADDAIIEALKVKWRDCVCVIDEEDASGDILLYDASYYLFIRTVEQESREAGNVIFSDPTATDGFAVSFRGKQKKMGKFEFVDAEAIDFVERKPYAEDVFDHDFCLDKLLEIPTYEEVLALFHGVEAEEKAPKDDVPPAKSGRRAAPKEEDDPPPARRRREEPADEPQDDPPPRSVGCGGRRREEPADEPPEDEAPPARGRRQREEPQGDPEPDERSSRAGRVRRGA